MPEAPPPKRFPIGRLAMIALLAVLLLGGGAFALLRFLRASPALDTAAPSDALFFFSVALDPSDEQKRAMEAILARLPADIRAEVPRRVEELADELLAEVGLTFRRDVRPWIGGEFAFVGPPAGAEEGPSLVGLMAVKDEGAARSALRRAAGRAEGDLAFRVEGGVAYVGDSARIVDDFRRAAERPLSDNDEYRRRKEQAGDALLLFWADQEGMGTLLESEGIPGFFGVPGLSFGDLRGSMVFALRAERNGIVAEGRQSIEGLPEAQPGRARLLEGSSSGLIGAVTLLDPGAGISATLRAFEGPQGPPGGIGGFIEEAIGLDLDRDLIPWLHGEMTVLMRGLGPAGPEAAVLIEVTDEATAERALATLRERLPSQGVDVRPAPDGFDLDFRDFPLAVRRSQGRLVVATSPAYAGELLEPAAKPLADDVVYRRVVGSPSDQTAAQLYLRVDRIRAVVEAVMPPEVRADYEQEVAPILRAVEAIGFRSVSSGSESSFKLLISLEES